MKHILSLCLLTLLTLSVKGQSRSVDSLINILNTQKLTFDEQSKLYSKICDIYLYSDMDKSLEYARVALDLAEKEKSIAYQSLFNEFIGKIYNYKSSSDSAYFYFNKALNLAYKAKDKKLEASINLCFGVYYNQQSKYTLALEHFMKALSLYEIQDNKVNMIIILGNVASIHRTINNFDRALYYLNKAEGLIKEIKESDYPIGIMNTYYELAGVYGEKGDDEKELEYTLKTLDLARKYGNINYEIVGLHALSFSSLKKADYDSALKYGKEALQLSEKLGHKYLILGVWCGLSDIYKGMGRWEECEFAAIRAFEIDSTDVHHNKTLLYNIAKANIYLGNKDKASAFLEKYKSYWVQSSEKSLHNSLTEMEVKYETEKKEIHIASLEKERQLYVWLGIAGIMFALSLGVLLWLKVRNSQKEKQLIASNAVQEGEMGERERIAGELHDRLLGSLSAIKSGIDNTSISDKLNGCIEEIRRISRNLMPLQLRFGVKTALEDFTAQFPSVKFHFFGQEKRIEKRLEFVVYCCANELVTNSIRHSGAKNINVQLVQGVDSISLTVQDDGCGFDEKMVTKGVGLKSIQDRVASCNGKIDISSSPGKGTETTIEIRC